MAGGHGKSNNNPDGLEPAEAKSHKDRSLPEPSDQRTFASSSAKALGGPSGSVLGRLNFLPAR